MFHIQSNNSTTPYFLCLSAGSVHVDNPTQGGLPLYESTVSSHYLIETLNIPPEYIFIETSSYDTISNAYYSRLMTDIMQWRRLLVITSGFHINRTRFVFEWVYNVSPFMNYTIDYYNVGNSGLDKKNIDIRLEKEKKSLESVRKVKSGVNSLSGVLEWMMREHELYNASLLWEYGDKRRKVDGGLRMSYGCGGEKVDSIMLKIVLIVLIVILNVCLIGKTVSKREKIRNRRM